MAVGLVIIAGGFLILSFVTPGTPYFGLAVAFAVLGAGMGMTAAPATGEIMSAVPLSKAGVGSAMNDTTRELGGALGIAILGSIATSAYRSAIDLVGARARRPGPRTWPRNRSGPLRWSPPRFRRGDAVRAQAASAFTDAFILASVVSVGIVARGRDRGAGSSPATRRR